MPSGKGTLSYASNGLTIEGTGSSETIMASNIPMPTGDYELSVDFKHNGTRYGISILVEDILLEVDINSSTWSMFKNSDSWTSVGTYNSSLTELSLKFEVIGTTIKVYFNNTLINTISNVTRKQRQGFRWSAQTRNSTYKNLKVKAL